MKVYVTGRGVRCQKRIYEKKAGLTRREAQHLKKRGILNVSREIADLLIGFGWASAEPSHPLAQVRDPGVLVPEPMPVTTQELEVAQTSESPGVPPEAEVTADSAESTPTATTSEASGDAEGEDTTQPDKGAGAAPTEEEDQ